MIRTECIIVRVEPAIGQVHLRGERVRVGLIVEVKGRALGDPGVSSDAVLSVAEGAGHAVPLKGSVVKPSELAGTGVVCAFVVDGAVWALVFPNTLVIVADLGESAWIRAD